MRRENKNIDQSNKVEEQLPDALCQLISSYKIPKGKFKEQTWQAIFEEINPTMQVKVIPFNRTMLKVAASIIMILSIASFALLYGLGNVEVIVSKGNHAVVFLPDSSEVFLNADSKLIYNKNRWFADRNVFLSGEAMFKVKKGSTFQVQTTTAKTSVLGTTFNVYSRKGLTKVSCIEGKVRVIALESKKEVILTKGLETKTMGYAMEKSAQTNYSKKKVAWTQGDFFFNNTPINSVIEELERQFDVDVFIDGDTNRFYTGYFSNRSLDDALQLVCLPMNLDWKTNGSMIILKEHNK